MNDEVATVKDLMDLVDRFCKERNWDQFHNPKDLAITLSIESSELLEFFRFKNADEVSALMSDPFVFDKVKQELSDVFYVVLRFAQMNGIDLSSELIKKLDINSSKYPVDQFKGSNKKYNE